MNHSLWKISGVPLLSLPCRGEWNGPREEEVGLANGKSQLKSHLSNAMQGLNQQNIYNYFRRYKYIQKNRIIIEIEMFVSKIHMYATRSRVPAYI